MLYVVSSSTSSSTIFSSWWKKWRSQKRILKSHTIKQTLCKFFLINFSKRCNYFFSSAKRCNVRFFFLVLNSHWIIVMHRSFLSFWSQISKTTRLSGNLDKSSSSIHLKERQKKGVAELLRRMCTQRFYENSRLTKTSFLNFSRVVRKQLFVCVFMLWWKRMNRVDGQCSLLIKVWYFLEFFNTI